MSDRLVTHTAYEMTRHILEVFNLRDDEYVEAHREVLERVIEGIEKHVERQRREWQRLGKAGPGEN